MFVRSVVCLTFLLLIQSQAPENDFYGKTEKEIRDFNKLLVENSTTIFSKASTNSIKFLLYLKYFEQPVVLTEKNAFMRLDRWRVTILIIHGWGANATLPWIKEAAKRLHNVGIFNIIAVDWSELASGDYFNAVKNLKVVGIRIKTFIKTVNIPVNTVHIIAHSLGAQVVPHLANALGTERLRRVDGLDPSGPPFDFPLLVPPSLRLTASCAKFVQVIHTSIFFRGVTYPSGTSDFYVNKGADQPECLRNITMSCSQELSHTYYILTIYNPFKYLATKWCPVDLYGCQTITFMGYWVDIYKSGIFNVTAGPTGINPYTQF